MKTFTILGIWFSFVHCALATYFLTPQVGETIEYAGGFQITWKYQPGGASRGTILLESLEPSTSDNHQAVIASDVDLTRESLSFPSKLNVRVSSIDSYRLLMVNSANGQTVYAQVSGFGIKSFSSSPAASTRTSRSRTDSATVTTITTTTTTTIRTTTQLAPTKTQLATSPPAQTKTSESSSSLTTNTSTSSSMGVVVVTSYAPLVTILVSASSSMPTDVIYTTITSLSPSPLATGSTGSTAQNKTSNGLRTTPSLIAFAVGTLLCLVV